MGSGKLFDAFEARDSNPHNSATFHPVTHTGTFFVISNGANQSASVQFQGRAAPTTVKTITLTAGNANDTFKLTFNAHESTSAVTIPTGGFANVTAAQIKACLLTISDWVGQTAYITVVKSTNDFRVSFSGPLAATDLGAITITTKTGAANGSVSEVNPWVNVGSAVVVAATTMGTAPTLTDPWPQYRAVVTYSTPPSIGSLYVWWIAHGTSL